MEEALWFPGLPLLLHVAKQRASLDYDCKHSLRPCSFAIIHMIEGVQKASCVASLRKIFTYKREITHLEAIHGCLQLLSILLYLVAVPNTLYDSNEATSV